VHYKLFTKNKFILKVSSNMNYYDEFHPFWFHPCPFCHVI
jgi:hypothetical protein